MSAAKPTAHPKLKMKADPDSAPNQLNGTLPIITHGDFKLGQSRYELSYALVFWVLRMYVTLKLSRLRVHSALQTYAAYLALPSTCATPKAAAIDAMFQVRPYSVSIL